MFDRIALKSAAKQRVHSAVASPVLVTLVFLLVSYIISTVTGFFSMRSFDFDALQNVETLEEFVEFSSYHSPLYSLFTMVLGWVASIWGVGYQSYALRLSRSDDADYKQLPDGLRRFGVMFLAMILMDIFTALWTLLFVIPGIIALYRYRLTYYILLDNPEMGVLDAIRASKRLMCGYKWKLFVLDLSFIPWHLLCGLTLGILYCWKLPYIEATYANAYQAICAANAAENVLPPDNFQS